LKELEAFLAGKPVNLGKVLGALPADADAELAARCVMRLVGHPHWLAASCTKLPARVIQLVLADVRAPLLLRLAGPDGWVVAVEALRVLADTVHPWDSELRKEHLAALASEPVVLAAVQGVVANTADPPLAMLGVLALDGGDASIDALVPHLSLGEIDQRLERLERLRGYAKATPALAALFAELATALAEHRKRSPALALAAELGLAPADTLSFYVLLQAVDQKARGSVRVDSREHPWFTVWVGSDAGATRFDEANLFEDTAKLGRCDPAGLPSWLARVAKKLGVVWQQFHVQTELPFAESQKIAQWLATPKRKKPTSRGGARSRRSR
jgi:hypothetical protein